MGGRLSVEDRQRCDHGTYKIIDSCFFVVCLLVGWFLWSGIEEFHHTYACRHMSPSPYTDCMQRLCIIVGIGHLPPGSKATPSSITIYGDAALWLLRYTV